MEKYLDTSAMAKLYIDEDGSECFRKYFYSHTNFCTTIMTFYETMNVLKSRLHKEEYYKAVTNLEILGWGGKIEIDPIDLKQRDNFKEVSSLAIESNLDIADAFVIHAILKGRYSRLVQGSASVLITADEPQGLAAQKNKIRVWNCRKEPKPEWLDN